MNNRDSGVRGGSKICSDSPAIVEQPRKDLSCNSSTNSSYSQQHLIENKNEIPIPKCFGWLGCVVCLLWEKPVVKTDDSPSEDKTQKGSQVDQNEVTQDDQKELPQEDSKKVPKDNPNEPLEKPVNGNTNTNNPSVGQPGSNPEKSHPILKSPPSLKPPVLKPPHILEPPKFENPEGITCFLNTALQSFISTSEFHTLYVMRPYSGTKMTAKSALDKFTYTREYSVPSKISDDTLRFSVTSKPGPLTTGLNMLLWKIHETSFISLRDLLMHLGKRNERFTKRRQEDSHEALRCIFDALRDEELQAVKKHIENLGRKQDQDEEKIKLKGYLRMTTKLPTAIGQVIEGKLISVTVCHGCCDVSENSEPFFDISLPMPEENNDSYSKKMLETSIVPANDHYSKQYGNVEGSDTGHLQSGANQHNVTNRLAVVSPEAKQQDQPAQHMEKSNYLTTHDKIHFQEYLRKKGLNFQRSGKKQADTSDLQFCLSMYTDLDVLDEHNKFICQACNARKQSTDVNEEPVLCQVSKQIMIHHLPPVLILHMKRFEIGPYDVTKDDRHISFPEILDMAPYCTTECTKKLGDAKNRILYGLYSVIVHQGSSLHSGHYIAYVKIRPTKENSDKEEHGTYDESYCKSGQWYFTSDTNVRKCSLEEVKGRKAYMLFYERLPFIPTHATMI